MDGGLRMSAILHEFAGATILAVLGAVGSIATGIINFSRKTRRTATRKIVVQLDDSVLTIQNTCPSGNATRATSRHFATYAPRHARPLRDSDPLGTVPEQRSHGHAPMRRRPSEPLR
jgi:hypothetical protein